MTSYDKKFKRNKKVKIPKNSGPLNEIEIFSENPDRIFFVVEHIAEFIYKFNGDYYIESVAGTDDPLDKIIMRWCFKKEIPAKLLAFMPKELQDLIETGQLIGTNMPLPPMKGKPEFVPNFPLKHVINPEIFIGG
jgi:hypothetical protein